MGRGQQELGIALILRQVGAQFLRAVLVGRESDAGSLNLGSDLPHFLEFADQHQIAAGNQHGPGIILGGRLGLRPDLGDSTGSLPLQTGQTLAVRRG